MTTETPTPAQRFALTLQCLSNAVGAMSGGNRLSFALIAFIATRIREIKQCVARIVARLDAGSYAPRRFSARPAPAARPPRPPSLVKLGFGWLLPLLPGANSFRSQLEILFCDPEMAALLAAAPASLRRPIRSVCWMLRIVPPQVLARPKRPKPKPASPSPLAGEGRGEGSPPPEPQPPQPPLPDWLKDRRKPWSLARIRGSPHRA